MNYTIRKAKPEDVIPAFALALKTFDEYESPYYEEGALERFKSDCTENEKYINNYVMGKHLLLIALDGDKIIGIINERGNAHISMLFVDGKYHRLGVATALMSEMVCFLKQQGYNRITVNSSPYGEPFYHHFGFVDDGVRQTKDGFVFTPMFYEMNEIWDIYDSDRNKTGKTIERGRPMTKDEYHIVVYVWIKNSRGEWLISKRTPNKPFPNIWEPTGGSAIVGDDSITAAMREVKEELGVELKAENGRLFKSIIRPKLVYPDFCDIWVFDCDCPIENIVLQERETCDAMWATNEKIRQMIESGEFIPLSSCSYLDELFEAEA